MQIIKYPHSNLKGHHSKYLNLVDTFFRTMYPLNFYVSLEDNGIVIQIYGVNPNKIYNPNTFEPSYKSTTNNNEIQYISHWDFFETFYIYLPDIVPYLTFELYFPYNYMGLNEYGSNEKDERYFDRFNVRDLYYQYESRKQQYTVTRRVNSWGDNGVHNNQFVL